MLAIHPYTVTVRKRLAPLLAAAQQTIPHRRSQACAMEQVGVKAWNFPLSMLAWKLGPASAMQRTHVNKKLLLAIIFDIQFPPGLYCATP